MAELQLQRRLWIHRTIRLLGPERTSPRRRNQLRSIPMSNLLTDILTNVNWFNQLLLPCSEMTKKIRLLRSKSRMRTITELFSTPNRDLVSYLNDFWLTLVLVTNDSVSSVQDRSPSRDGQMFRPPGGAPAGASNVSLEPRPHTSCRAVSPKPARSTSVDQKQQQNVLNAAEKKASIKRSPSDRRPNGDEAGAVSAMKPRNENNFSSSLLAEFDQKVAHSPVCLSLPVWRRGFICRSKWTTWRWRWTRRVMRRCWNMCFPGIAEATRLWETLCWTEWKNWKPSAPFSPLPLLIPSYHGKSVAFYSAHLEPSVHCWLCDFRGHLKMQSLTETNQWPMTSCRWSTTNSLYRFEAPLRTHLVICDLAAFRVAAF